MAIKGVIQGATVAITATGMTMGASVALVDDVLGQVGQRGIAVDTPEVVEQVRAYIESMLPSLSAVAGYTVEMPEATE